MTYRISGVPLPFDPVPPLFEERVSREALGDERWLLHERRIRHQAQCLYQTDQLSRVKGRPRVIIGLPFIHSVIFDHYRRMLEPLEVLLEAIQ